MESKTNNKSKSFEYKIEDLYQSQNYYINHLFDLYGSDKGSLSDKIKNLILGMHTRMAAITLNYLITAGIV